LAEVARIEHRHRDRGPLAAVLGIEEPQHQVVVAVRGGGGVGPPRPEDLLAVAVEDAELEPARLGQAREHRHVTPAIGRPVLGDDQDPGRPVGLGREYHAGRRRRVTAGWGGLAEAGGLELRIFNRDGKKILGTRRPDPAAAPDGNHDLMLRFLNAKNGGEWASVPVAVFYTRDFRELHRYFEYPAIYHKDLLRGQMGRGRPGESEAQAKDRAAREFVALQGSPFFDVWAAATVDEILSALYEKRIVGV